MSLKTMRKYFSVLCISKRFCFVFSIPYFKHLSDKIFVLSQVKSTFVFFLIFWFWPKNVVTIAAVTSNILKISSFLLCMSTYIMQERNEVSRTPVSRLTTYACSFFFFLLGFFSGQKFRFLRINLLFINIGFRTGNIFPCLVREDSFPSFCWFCNKGFLLKFSCLFLACESLTSS